jgi:hypothetical protein
MEYLLILEPKVSNVKVQITNEIQSSNIGNLEFDIPLAFGF